MKVASIIIKETHLKTNDKILYLKTVWPVFRETKSRWCFVSQKKSSRQAISSKWLWKIQSKWKHFLKLCLVFWLAYFRASFQCLINQRFRFINYNQCGISFQIFKLTLCSAGDALSEDEIKKIYKFSSSKKDTIDATNYIIIKGRIDFHKTHSDLELEDGFGTIVDVPH